MVATADRRADSVTPIGSRRPNAVRSRPVVHRSVGTNVVIGRPADGSAIVLNESAAAVWRLAATWVEPSALARELTARYPTSADEVRRGVDAALELLIAEELLDVR